MTKTEKFWHLVEGLCSPIHFGSLVVSVIGEVKDPRSCFLVMPCVPSFFLEEARKRRLSVTVWPADEWSRYFSPYRYVVVWLTPDNLRWR